MVTATGLITVPVLTRWGLSPDADLVFRTLAMCGSRTPPMLERDLGISLSRVERALSALSDAGLVIASVQDGHRERRWRSVDSRALHLKLQGLRAKTRRARPQATIESTHHAPYDHLGDGLRHLPSRQATRMRLAELVPILQRSMMTMNPEVAFDAASLHAAAPLDRKLQARGIEIRVMGAYPGDPDLLCPFGGVPKDTLRMYRQADAIPMKLIIIDRQLALFPVDPRNLDRGYLEISQHPVVQSLASTFEQHWAAAHDPSETTMPAFELSQREEALVALLSLGHTDAGVAREMRISERSVSNIVRSIMDRFGVDNRFQLGVVLGELRIAPLPPGAPAVRREEAHEEAP